MRVVPLEQHFIAVHLPRQNVRDGFRVIVSRTKVHVNGRIRVVAHMQLGELQRELSTDRVVKEFVHLNRLPREGVVPRLHRNTGF